MRRADDTAATGGAADGAKGSEPFACGPAERLAVLRRVTSAAMLCGLALSPGLWFRAGDSFPRAPLFQALPRSIVAPTEYVLAGLLIAALACLAFARRTRVCETSAVVLLAVLVMLDQTRLQPWVYQYMLLLVVTSLHARRDGAVRTGVQVLAASQLIVAALYFWGGVQKLNYTFLREVVPQLLAPLQDLSLLTQTQLTALGVGAALCEIFLGCGLLLKRTRRPCVWLALAMHVLILGLLIWEDVTASSGRGTLLYRRWLLFYSGVATRRPGGRSPAAGRATATAARRVRWRSVARRCRC